MPATAPHDPVRFIRALQDYDFEISTDTYSIEGKVFPPESYVWNVNWQSVSRILINGGEYLGFLKEDGTFTIDNVPSGSYVLEVSNPNYAYEPVRVEINSKGKFRARKVNYIQPSVVSHVNYPLRIKPLTRYRYFQVREQWRITDFLFSPMVLMMVLPLVLIMVLTKMMSDPETKRVNKILDNTISNLSSVSILLSLNLRDGYSIVSGNPLPQSTSRDSVVTSWHVIDYRP
ncbi:hypothetical protein PR048_021635 [Dryococelus australis]|uniref:ER membrane protein complex subunit 7 beta-sandwich domain-containing protein n=1 Tax=Dryococelus australis TaxID=614101 RepID=A0ABQ9GYT8_9NEOP|nr:hypothetical protein PR048_021635 [Dryococelus australis]